MTKTTISFRIDSGQTKVAVTRAVEPKVRRATEESGKEMIAIANALMAGEFNLNRPYERRRHPSSRRAATALDYAIKEESDGTLHLQYRVLGGDEVLARIMFMNYGTAAHWITPSGAWPLKGKSGKSVQSVRFGGARRGKPTQDVLAWTDEDGQVVTEEVDHPGQAGTGFLEEAARATVNLFGATLRR